MRKKRLKMGLMQKEVADQLGVNSWTILNWEKGGTKPPIASIPSIVQFLAYDPFPQPRTLPDYLLANRREMGWSIKEAAKAVGVDPCSWGNWEHGQIILYRRHRDLIAGLLGLSAHNLDREMAARWIRSHKRTH